MKGGEVPNPVIIDELKNSLEARSIVINYNKLDSTLPYINIKNFENYLDDEGSLIHPFFSGEYLIFILLREDNIENFVNFIKVSKTPHYYLFHPNNYGRFELQNNLSWIIDSSNNIITLNKQNIGIFNLFMWDLDPEEISSISCKYFDLKEYNKIIIDKKIIFSVVTGITD